MEGLPGQVGKVVVGQELQLQLIGLARQAGGIGGGDHRVGQLPDAAHRVFEGPVAVDHHLHVQPPLLCDPGLDAVHHWLAVPGEELQLLLGGLVRAQHAVLVVIAAAVHRGGHHVSQGEDGLAHGLEHVPGFVPGVDIAAEHLVTEGGDVAAVVGEEEGGLGPLALNDLPVEVQVVDPGEGVDGGAKGFDKVGLLEVIDPAVPVLQIGRADHEGVAHLVVGVAEQNDHLVHGPGDALQAHGEPVPAENGEDQPQLLRGEFIADILGNLIHSDIVALGPGHHGLGHGDHIPVLQGVAVCLLRRIDTVYHDIDDVVPLADDGASDASGNNACHGHVLQYSSRIGSFLPKKYRNYYTGMCPEWQVLFWQKRGFSPGFFPVRRRRGERSLAGAGKFLYNDLKNQKGGPCFAEDHTIQRVRAGAHPSPQ